MKKDSKLHFFVGPQKSGTASIGELLGVVLSKLLGREKSPRDKVKAIKDGMIHYSKSEQGK